MQHNKFSEFRDPPGRPSSYRCFADGRTKCEKIMTTPESLVSQYKSNLIIMSSQLISHEKNTLFL